MKRCSICKVSKPFSDFGRRAAMRDGYTSQCKQCNSSQQRAFAKAHPERIAATQRKYYEKNRKRLIKAAAKRTKARWPEHLAASRERRWVTDWASNLVRHAKHAARARDREFSITKADVERLFERQNGRCYWLNVPFVFEVEPRHPQRPSIDRLDPSRGYTPDNVVLACLFANIGRNTLSAARFGAFLTETGLRATETVEKLK